MEALNILVLLTIQLPLAIEWYEADFLIRRSALKHEQTRLLALNAVFPTGMPSYAMQDLSFILILTFST